MVIIIRISIHAPRAGRDEGERVCVQRRQHFNPRAPCGARPASARSTLDLSSYFNPRAPCGARQHLPDGPVQLHGISIHAPRAGRDRRCGATMRLRSLYFNPRAPCGARPDDFLPEEHAEVFQSTRPVRGATRYDLHRKGELLHFNPRAPCGARRAPPGARSPGSHFNPRAPCGARQQKYTKLLYTLLRQKAIFRQFHAKRRLLKRFSTYKYRNTFLVCSANRMGKICTLPLRTTRSLDLPEGMSACSQSARFCFRTFFPSSKTADYPAPDP